MITAKQAQLAYLVKKAMPRPVLREVQVWKERFSRRVRPGPVQSPPLEDQYPWMSPNVWARLDSFCLPIPNPRIFEYGTGVSTMWHIRKLVTVGGTYIGVEHKPDWYLQVLQAIVGFGVRYGLTITWSGETAASLPDFAGLTYDSTLRIQGLEDTMCDVELKLRPPRNRIPGSDGTLEEFQEYVNSLDKPCDVVIVDGRTRKACVNHILDTHLLKPGGMLVLCEAGRGKDGWLGSPAMTGTSDYQPEVHRMLALGGDLMDGIGLDKWPGLKKRRSSISNAYCYPQEACFLHFPSSNGAVTA